MAHVHNKDCEHSKGGRPTKYSPELCDKVLEMLRQGYCKYEIALELDVDVDTLANWEKANPEFFGAMKKGSDLARGWWQKHGRTNIGNKDFNSTLWYMNMKNRWGWKDKSEVETNVNLRDETDRKVRQAEDAYK